MEQEIIICIPPDQGSMNVRPDFQSNIQWYDIGLIN